MAMPAHAPSHRWTEDEYYAARDAAPAGERWGASLLAAEVISPRSARFDRVIKRPRYQRHNVPEYWVIDPEAQTFERWQPADERPEILFDRLAWHPSNAAEPFELDIPAFFRDATPL